LPKKRFLGRLGGGIDSAPLQTNIPLIRHGSDLILIDTGAGGNFQPSDGRLATNLASIGVDPASITKVIFTHAHPDHSGGTTQSDGSLLFPNAHYYVNESEWSFWTDPDYKAKMREPLHAFARGAQRDLFSVKDRLTTVKPGDEIVSGMNVISTRGHTPGHISLELSGDGNLLIAGDVIPNDIVSFENPSWHFGFDTEPEIALTNRGGAGQRGEREASNARIPLDLSRGSDMSSVEGRPIGSCRGEGSVAAMPLLTHAGGFGR
jgi:glyoxylase-like metal-dependent hydrolase (beta-lactamase superfamily II)